MIEKDCCKRDNRNFKSQQAPTIGIQIHSFFQILLTNSRIFAFLIYTITLGIDISLCEIYTFWLAEQRLQASSTILAAAIACSTCFEIVAYLVSEWFVRGFGAILVMTVGLLMLGVGEFRLKVGLMVTKPSRIFEAFRLESEASASYFFLSCHACGLNSRERFWFPITFSTFFVLKRWLKYTYSRIYLCRKNDHFRKTEQKVTLSNN